MTKIETKKPLENKKEEFAIFSICTLYDEVAVSFVCMIKNKNALKNKTQVTKFRKLLEKYNFEFDREKSIYYADTNLKTTYDFLALYDGEESCIYGEDLNGLCKKLEPRLVQTVRDLPQIAEEAKKMAPDGDGLVESIMGANASTPVLGADSEGFSQIVKCQPIEFDGRPYGL